jgi:hypothetical protein
MRVTRLPSILVIGLAGALATGLGAWSEQKQQTMPPPLPKIWHNIRADPQIIPGTGSWDSSMFATPQMKVCQGPPDSQGCADNWWTITIIYLVKNDADPDVHFPNVNVEVGKIECGCTCGGADR